MGNCDIKETGKKVKSYPFLSQFRRTQCFHCSKFEEEKGFHDCWSFIFHEVKTHKNLKQERKETEPSFSKQPRLIQSILLERKTGY